ncbi:Hsp20/alpha crystallin family protein [Candida parapsilosis]|uniref:SHSP domain-containing protein n=2 Tax=Candida parapsilosis TaxID=5480 RepID=G8BKX6_CANPC|nr:uncharacterized protein CPAR2_704060 [Candida parapsilosis]KAF6042029.1 Hsp20/alpha crystallin family protein [Candida parapsilosis]KAF6042308.1 Hsp20/alpha crystallin family protein [Candida parapsilosis]KAF6042753.1 Hsp20/alpha crystallin family protein [Candida parapsilosis]KAF6058238.1 Hsp20/alpha crystallin family protein [Candida parapsilosis]KAI5904160.1 hypothetical protein K4G60_g3318 [Candida parapsilosis]
MFRQILRSKIAKAIPTQSTALVTPTRAYLTFPKSLPTFPQDFFDHDWFNDSSITNYFKTKQTPESYQFTITDPNIKNKDVKIDFCKPDNALLVSVNQNLNEQGKHSQSKFASVFTNKYVFDKPVDYNDIKADHDAKTGEVIITVPKLEKDDENLVNIKLNHSSTKA